MEGIGGLCELFAQNVVLFLSLLLTRKLVVTLLKQQQHVTSSSLDKAKQSVTSHSTYSNDLLEVAPGVFKRLHREPRVRVEADVEALDLLVELVELLEVLLSSRQRRLELLMRLTQCL